MSLSTAPDTPPLTVVSSLPDQERRKKPLCDCVRSSLMLYLKDLNGHAPQKLHQMVMGEVERPLLEIVMNYVEGNQTKASQILGINRSTLRKKLTQYGLG